MSLNKIYFDNSSTSFPKADGVSQAMYDILENGAYNINRGGYNNAQSTAQTVLETRMLLKAFFSSPYSIKNVIFTSGITMSLNYIIKGYLKKGDHVIISSMEHNAVMRPLVQMNKAGVDFSVLEGDMCGKINPQNIFKLITPKTKAIIITAASNVCGTVTPLKKIGEVCRDNNIKLIVDCAQYAGVLPINMQEMNIEALCFTGHKGLLGPQGIGGLIISDDIAFSMDTIISGGTGSFSDNEEVPTYLPDKFEAGTINIPGIIGLKAGIEFINKIGMEEIYKHEMKLTLYFLEGLKKLSDIRIVGVNNTDNRVAVVSVDFLQLDNAQVSYSLDNEYGIMTRCGLHCAPRAHKTIGTFPHGTVRFSFGRMNTIQEIDKCLLAIKDLINREINE